VCTYCDDDDDNDDNTNNNNSHSRDEPFIQIHNAMTMMMTVRLSVRRADTERSICSIWGEDSEWVSSGKKGISGQLVVIS